MLRYIHCSKRSQQSVLARPGNRFRNSVGIRITNIVCVPPRSSHSKRRRLSPCRNAKPTGSKVPEPGRSGRRSTLVARMAGFGIEPDLAERPQLGRKAVLAASIVERLLSTKVGHSVRPPRAAPLRSTTWRVSAERGTTGKFWRPVQRTRNRSRYRYRAGEPASHPTPHIRRTSRRRAPRFKRALGPSMPAGKSLARVSSTMPSLLFDPFPEQEKTGVRSPCFSPVPARTGPVFGITGKSPKNPVIAEIYRERISLLSPKNIMPCFHRLFWATASRGDSVSSPASAPYRRPHRRCSVRSPEPAPPFRNGPSRMRRRKEFSPQTSRILRGSPPWARGIVWQSAQIIWKFRAIASAIPGSDTPLRLACVAPAGSIRRPAPARDCCRAAAMVGAREGKA